MTSKSFPQLTCDDLSSVPLNYNVDWQTEVFPLFVDGCPGVGGCGFSACAQCHTAPFEGSRLIITPSSSGLTLVRLLDPAQDWIIPARPEQSRLFAHINCQATNPADLPWRMPLFGNTMSLSQQALVYDWILQGARGTDPDGNPMSDIVFSDQLESARSYRAP